MDNLLSRARAGIRAVKPTMLGIAGLWLLSAPAALGTDATTTDLAASTVTYPAAYFAEYDPVSVKDMLDRIPGITVALEGSVQGPTAFRTRRGLGAGEDQILINGKRLAGKENEGRNQLDRIAAASVDYIEIIRGTSGEMDVRSAGQIINVVLKAAASRQSVATELTMHRYHDGTVDPGGLLSVSGQRDRLDYVLSAAAVSLYEHRIRHETSVNGDLSPRDALREVQTRDQMRYTYNTNLGYQWTARDLVHFNAMYREYDPPTSYRRWITDLMTAPVGTIEEREQIAAEQDKWEVGGDYEHRFANGGKYRFLFVVNEADYDSVRERFRVTTPTETKNMHLRNARTTEERIIRTSYTRPLADGQDLEIGVERAETILDSTLGLGLAGIPGTPSADVGGLVPVAVANANSTVEEMRYEVFGVHNWQLNPRMSLETSLLLEFSEISQRGDATNSRDFEFVRPKIDYRFDITPSFQLRATIAKDVSQLSFRDFVATSNEQDTDQDAMSGNPELVQQQAWQYEMNLEYRLPRDGGVLSSRFFYHDLEDVIDKVDVSPAPGSLDSAPGNIGDGKRYGIVLNASLRFRFLAGALLTTTLSLQDTEVTDPFLGIKRGMAMQGKGYGRIGFRHDLKALDLHYGFNYYRPIRGDQKQFDIDDIEDYWFEPEARIFVEKVAFERYTVRLEYINVTKSFRCRERTRYLGATWDDVTEEIEESCSTPGRSISLKVRATF